MKRNRIIRILNCCVFSALVFVVVLSMLMKPDPIRDAQKEIEGWEKGVLPIKDTHKITNRYPVQKLQDGRVAFPLQGQVPSNNVFFGVPKKHQYIGYYTDHIFDYARGFQRVYSPIYRFWFELVDETGKKIDFKLTTETYKTDVKLTNHHPWAFMAVGAEFMNLTILERLKITLGIVITRFRFFKYLLVGAIILFLVEFITARQSRNRTVENESSQQSNTSNSEHTV